MNCQFPNALFASYVDRMAIFVGVFLLCVAVAYYASATRSLTVQKPENALADLENTPFLTPADGHWSFVDSPCQIITNEVTTKDLLGALSQWEHPPETTTSDLDATHLVELANQYGMDASTEGNITTYRLDEAERHVRLIVEVQQSQVRLIVAALAIAADNETWQLHQILPSDQLDDSVANHLLPLPPSAVSTGQRHARNGELLMELVAMDSPVDRLLEQWTDAGWEIHHSDWGSADSFSYLCVRGAEVVYAWSARSKPGELLLTKTEDISQRLLRP